MDKIDAEAQLAGLSQSLCPHDPGQGRVRRMQEAVDDATDDERRKRKDGVVIGLPGSRPRQFGHRSIAAQ